MLGPVPIAYMAFNRPQTVDITLKALCEAEGAKQHVLHVFIDAPRFPEEQQAVDHVKALSMCDYVQQSFASVRYYFPQHNIGACHMHRYVVNTMASLSPAFIFLEDDVLFSPYTLRYFNAALEKYAEEKTVFSVNGWCPPAMKIPSNYPWDAWFCPRAHIWGWASWSDRVKNIDWTGSAAFEMEQYPFLIEAFNQGGDDMAAMLLSTLRAPTIGWDIVMDFHRFRHGQLSLTPFFPYSMNIGSEVSSIGSGSINLAGQGITHAKENPVLPHFVYAEQVFVQAHKAGIAACYS